MFKFVEIIYFLLLTDTQKVDGKNSLHHQAGQKPSQTKINVFTNGGPLVVRCLKHDPDQARPYSRGYMFYKRKNDTERVRT